MLFFAWWCLVWDNTVIPLWITGVPLVVSQKERRKTGTESETEVGWSDTEGGKNQPCEQQEGKAGCHLQVTSCRHTKLLRFGAEAACLLTRVYPHHESGVSGVAGLFLMPFLKCFGWKPVCCHAHREIGSWYQRNKCLERNDWITGCSLPGSKVLTMPAQET